MNRLKYAGKTNKTPYNEAITKRRTVTMPALVILRVEDYAKTHRFSFSEALSRLLLNSMVKGSEQKYVVKD